LSAVARGIRRAKAEGFSRAYDASHTRNIRNMKKFAFALGTGLFVAASAVGIAQIPSLAENEAIAYSKTAPADAVARLQKKIDAGETTLEYDDAHGYLPAVLRALDVPVASQGLVFSRTSLQVDRIAPWTPRAVYFNDGVYVGWVQGGPIMEIASVDPKLGAVFYTLSQDRTDRPKFERQTHTCLQCHDSSSSTGGVPGFIMRSVVTDRYGYPVAAGAGATTDQTPLEERWGGWYVTGTMGNLPHKGNVFAPVLSHEMGNAQSYLARTKLVSTGDVESLAGRFDTDPYLAPHSDAVALLLLAHQAVVHNLITLANFEARKAAYIGGADGGATPAVTAAADRLARAMLFVKAAPLPAPVKGTSTFAADFSARGPRDHQGRSLRDLDLERRIFKYPLSYLIYSEGFDALPAVVTDRVYLRLREVLTGKDTSPEYAHLSDEDRKAILEILTDTKPDFAKVPLA
jgi:hypothetical protein